MKNKILYYFFGLLSFAIPAVLFLSNASNSLGFADAGEFALVTKIFGIAHPPGFPSYVFIGGLFGKIFSFLSANHVQNMVWYSVICSSIGCFLLFATGVKILSKQQDALAEILQYLVGLCCAVGFASGVTVWYWSHGVEVYALQIMAFALLLYGLVSYQFQQKISYIIIAAIGVALGLTNHHLTMILFIPFIFLFVWKPILVPAIIQQGKKNKHNHNATAIWNTFINEKHWAWAIGISAGITAMFYFLMMFRAAADLPFKFGSPDTIDRLIYHLSGGAWIKNTQQEVEGIIAMRFPYFMQLTIEQLMLLLPFVVAGIVFLFRRNLKMLLLPTAAFYLILLFYQLRIDQTSDTDAYMVLPFYALYLLVPYGVMQLHALSKYIVYLLPVLTLVSPVVNYAKANSVDYNVSSSIMKTLDYSTPKNSVVIIADWTTVAQYYYYRLAENFRPDLIVLNYDLKFTHKDILPNVYPEFYQFIKPEYDRFIQLLIQYHPEQAYNTGCTLDNVVLSNAFRDLTNKIQQYAKVNNVAYLVDPKTFVFSLRDKLMTTQSSVSGMFVSNNPQPTGLGKEFLDLEGYNWIQSERLMRDPAAGDKMVDLEAMFDFHRNYYRSAGDEASYQKAEASYQRIKKLQREMKEQMEFLFRPQGK
jgi:hypothetical protein